MSKNVMQASFFKRAVLTGLERVTVRQKFSNHTLVFLDYKFRDKRQYLLPPENTPVVVRWGSSPSGVKTFYGYVNHYETVPDDAQYRQASTRIVLMGTSKVMRTSAPSSWSGQTRSSIFRDIVSRYHLRSVTHDHPYPVDAWAAGLRSDWECLQDLANEAGYRFWVDGSTAWFLNPERLLNTATSMSTPVITRKDIRGVSVMGGSHIPGEVNSSTRRIQFGLDYRTNEFFLATSGDPSLPTQIVPSTAVTYADTQEMANATDILQSDYYVLKAKVNGNSMLEPGALTLVESGTVNSDQAGLWMVNEAFHEVMADEFTSRIVATRDQNQQPLSRTTDTLRGMNGNTTAVIRDGSRWEAALQEQVHA